MADDDRRTEIEKKTSSFIMAVRAELHGRVRLIFPETPRVGTVRIMTTYAGKPLSPGFHGKVLFLPGVSPHRMHPFLENTLCMTRRTDLIDVVLQHFFVS